MSKHAKIFLISLCLATGFVVAVSPTLLGWAAPPPLPSCGHSPISSSPSLVSFGPDIDFSKDANTTYTAVVWSGEQRADSQRGSILLAYSDVQTTTRDWSYIEVDTDTSLADRSLDPRLAFDPDDPETVHLTHKKGQGIVYRQCDLGTGSCPVFQDLTYTANSGSQITDDLPQIAILNDNVVIVYQEDNNETVKSIKYIVIPNRGLDPPSASVRVTDTSLNATLAEVSASIGAANDTLHVAYAFFDDDDSTVRYARLTESELLNGSSTTFAREFDPLFTTASNPPLDPDLPALDVSGSRVAIVWQLRRFELSEYVLAYNVSNNNGNSFEFPTYRYLLADDAIFTNNDPWETSLPDVFAFGGGLKPDVFVDADGDLHVAWHAQLNLQKDRHDALYTRVDPDSVTGWQGNPNLAPPISYTNVTTFYSLSEQLQTGEKLDKVRPRVVFGPPGERLQAVYMSQTAAGAWEIFYNGWQLGLDEGEPTNDQTLTFADTDCDSIPDEVEKSGTPECTNPNQITEPFPDCDADGIPDFLDEESNGAGGDDYDTWNKVGTPTPTPTGTPIGQGTDPGDPTSTPTLTPTPTQGYRVYISPFTYLPVILKANN